MNISAARQGVAMRPSAKNVLRAAIGAGACAATIALVPISRAGADQRSEAPPTLRQYLQACSGF